MHFHQSATKPPGLCKSHCSLPRFLWLDRVPAYKKVVASPPICSNGSKNRVTRIHHSLGYWRFLKPKKRQGRIEKGPITSSKCVFLMRDSCQEVINSGSQLSNVAVSISWASQKTIGSISTQRNSFQQAIKGHQGRKTSKLGPPRLQTAIWRFMTKGTYHARNMLSSWHSGCPTNNIVISKVEPLAS